MGKKLDNKKMLFAIIMIVIIIIIVLVLLIQLNKDKLDNENDIQDDEGEDFVESYGIDVNGAVDNSSYLDVMYCAEQYFDALNIKNDAYYTYNENDEYVLAIEENVLKQNIYDKLSKNYINSNGITIENIYDKIDTLEENVLLVPLEIAMLQNENAKTFIIHILLETQGEYEILKETFIAVNIDIRQNVYSIEPLGENYNNVAEIKLNNLENEIEVTENNKFKLSYATNEELSKDYINLYKRLSLGAPEKMYELLDQEYRNSKFGSLDNFKKYVQDNRKQIVGTRLEKYQVTRQDDYTQYVCIDQRGKYYIFKETEPMQYTVILDTYTIDLPEFIEKYELASNEDKVLMNVQRFFNAIEDSDYKYAYNKLDNTFKNDNFKTQEEFENYIKQNFFTKNTLSAGTAQKQGDVYLYDLTITDGSETTNRTITKRFAVQLKEGTDFVMSFGK